VQSREQARLGRDRCHGVLASGPCCPGIIHAVLLGCPVMPRSAARASFLLTPLDTVLRPLKQDGNVTSPLLTPAAGLLLRVCARMCGKADGGKDAAVTCTLHMAWDDRLTRYDFGPSHPLAPVRVELTVELARDF